MAVPAQFPAFLLAVLAFLAIAFWLRFVPGGVAALGKRLFTALAGPHGLGDFVLRRILTVASCFALVLVAVVLFEEVFFRQPDPTRVGSLVVLLLLLAVCLQAGPRLISHLKKLGPLELFEQTGGAIDSLLDSFAEFDLRLEPDAGKRDLIPRGGPLSPSERFAYEQVDLLLVMIAHSGENLTADQEMRYFKVSRVVGATALGRGDWPRAIARFERLQRVSKGLYEPLDVAQLLGSAYLVAALAPEENQKKTEFLIDAAACFGSVVKEDPKQVFAWYRLGVVEHLRRNYGSAIEANQRALQIRPQFAPAKYNLAVSYFKSGEHDKALTALSTVSRRDEDFSKVREGADTDPEIDELRNDPRFVRIIGEWQD